MLNCFVKWGVGGGRSFISKATPSSNVETCLQDGEAGLSPFKEKPLHSLGSKYVQDWTEYFGQKGNKTTQIFQFLVSPTSWPHMLSC